ncbi:myb/SANT-like DNA-binding domain-containing protein 4 [Eupeodes corollae]|uniref:myb/SANT-like DNA-binding domain-containing protein 4 n=1 Tax=Eupeodes corollae TaxID=290404 RepID=UPI002491C768|nr:myb/SANT-like DNA-binding domain-containing protein 4 [Eupeodes corollae]
MSKLKRASNFSKAEEAVLIKLVLENKHILQNKKTDAITSRLKVLAWNELAQKYNASSFVEFRTPKVLREKYNNIMRNLRKEKADRMRDACNSPSPKQWKESENDSLIDELSIRLSSRHNDDGETIVFEEIDNRNELKTEIIDYYDDEDFEECAEEARDYDYSCVNSADIDTRFDGQIIDKSEEYHSATLKNKVLNRTKTEQPEKLDTHNSDLINLNKQILEQKYHHASLEHEQKMEHARLEHEQRISQSNEEHKLKIKILEAELESKKFSGKTYKR